MYTIALIVVVVVGEFVLLELAAPALAAEDPAQNARHLTSFFDTAADEV